MKAVTAVLAAVTAGICAVATITLGMNASGASNESLVFPVVHTDDKPPDGVLFRFAPRLADIDHRTGQGVYPGERVRLSCYEQGDPVGSYANTLWYQVSNVSRPSIDGQVNAGFLNSHYINDGRGLGDIDPGVPSCLAAATSTSASKSAPPPSSATPTAQVDAPTPSPVTSASPKSVDGITLGPALKPATVIGSCTVQEFSEPASKAVVYLGTVNGVTSLVRGGMLTGWLAQGGAAGGLGCPVTGEQQSASLQGHRVVVQQFQHGYQYWTNGMPAGVKVSLATIEAIRWSWDCLALSDCSYNTSPVGAVKNYYGYCLAFVYDAYRLGARVPPTGGPTDETATAEQWWTQNTTGSKVAGVTDAPPGDFVIWSTPAPEGGGHIALSIGAGWAISSWDGDQTTTIHLIQIAKLDPTAYLGYVSPGVS
jgi:hypothetical protein